LRGVEAGKAVSRWSKEFEMRFRIDVSTLDGKMSYERDTAGDALAVAEGARESLGVTITDTEQGETYSPDDFRKRFGN
jgi:hypothetical protein